MQEDVLGGSGGLGLPQQQLRIEEPGLVGQHVTINQAEMGIKGVEPNQGVNTPPNHAVIQPGLINKLRNILYSRSSTSAPFCTGPPEHVLGGEPRGGIGQDCGGELLFRGPQDHDGDQREGEGDQDEYDEAQDAQVPPQQKLPSELFSGCTEEKKNLDTRPPESLHDEPPPC